MGHTVDLLMDFLVYHDWECDIWDKRNFESRNLGEWW